MRPLKIIFIVTTVDGYGADKSMLSNIIFLKNKKQVEPLVILPANGSIEELLRNENIPYLIAGYKSWTKGYKLQSLAFLKPVMKKLNNYFKARKVAKQLQGQLFDFVHTNTFTTDFGMQLAGLMRTQHIMHIREIPFEQFNFKFEYPEQEIYRKVTTQSSAVLCNSPYTLTYFGDKIGREKLRLVPNPVFSQQTSPVPKSVREGAVRRFIIAGRYEPSKNQVDALQAANLLNSRGISNFTISMFGAGPLQEEYENYIQEHKLSHIISLNPYKKNLAAELSGFDIGIVCSRYEAFGRITVEFLLNGLPVIGNNTGNTPYLIRDGQNGFIYTFSNAEELAEKMLFFIRADNDTINEMSARAYQSLSNEFSIEKSSEILYSIYQDLAKKTL